MKTVNWIVFLCLSAGISFSQTFQSFLEQVAGHSDSLKMFYVDSFMNTASSFPYPDNDSTVYFIFRGNVRSITVIGDFNGWRDSSDQMVRIAGTNLWFLRRIFDAGARLDYKYVLNHAEFILDPLNPLLIRGGYGPNSELPMPRYVPSPEIEFYGNIPHGTLRDTSFFSGHLKNSRLIKIYLPPNYEYTDIQYPLVVFHDGLDFLSLGQMNNILDYLIWQKRIRPVVGIFIPAKDRRGEYAGNLKKVYAAFIVTELIPWVNEKFRIMDRPEPVATFGISNGGNIALWLGMQYPEIFQKVAVQSSNVEDSVALGYQQASFSGSQFYLDVGTYDIPVCLQLMDNLVKILENRGFAYRYKKYPEGHSWGSWRSHVNNALEMFFPGPALVMENKD